MTEPAAAAVRAERRARATPWARLVRARWLRRLLRNPSALSGGTVFLAFVLIAVFADALATHNPTRLYPTQRLQPPSADNFLGTDEFGRDIYSLVLHGSRISLVVGGLTMLFTSAGGTVIGLVAGYYRRLDLVIMRCMDGLMAFPAILLAIALMAARGQGKGNVIFALSVVYLPRTAMLIRSTVLSLRELEYVAAAQALGRGGLAIAFRHILPNCMGTLLVQGTFIFAYAVLAEAILGFLGVGVPPYVPSWGNVIASGKNVIREAVWVGLFPGLALTLAGLSLNLLGDGLRDTLDPWSKGASTAPSEPPPGLTRRGASPPFRNLPPGPVAPAKPALEGR
jgi:peptide/nickel transport system permease protein